MNDIDRRLADWNPVRAEDVVDAGHSVEANALLKRILTQPMATTPRLRWSHRKVAARLVWAAGLAATIVATVVIAVILWPAGTSRTPTRINPPQAQLVAFTTQGEDIVAEITDPLAAADQLTAVFQAHGLNIHVQTLPVSPSLVGTIVYSDVPIIRSLHAGKCLSGGGTSCEVGLVIPADFAEEANVAVGRAGQPGETFASSADVFGSGEILHCSGILGQPAASAVSVLQEKGVTAAWMVNGQRIEDPTPPDGYIVGGTALSSTTVLLDTSPEPLNTPEFQNYKAAANEGC